MHLNSLALFHMSLCTVSAHSHRRTHTHTHLYSALTMSVKIKLFSVLQVLGRRIVTQVIQICKERQQHEQHGVCELIAMSMCIRSLPVASMQVQELHQLSTKD